MDVYLIICIVEEELRQKSNYYAENKGGTILIIFPKCIMGQKFLMKFPDIYTQIRSFPSKYGYNNKLLTNIEE